MVLFRKRGELEWLAVPCDRGQHLGFAYYAAIVAQEHQFPDCSWLHWALQTQQPAGYGDDFQLRGASDSTGKSDYHRGFLFESNTLRAFAELSLGGIGHELSMNIFPEN